MGTYSGCGFTPVKGVAGKGARRRKQRQAEVKCRGGNQWCKKIQNL